MGEKGQRAEWAEKGEEGEKGGNSHRVATATHLFHPSLHDQVGATLSKDVSFRKCTTYCPDQPGGVCSFCSAYPDPDEVLDNQDPGNDPNYVAPFSSRGPTMDGRIKPDIVAP